MQRILQNNQLRRYLYLFKKITLWSETVLLFSKQINSKAVGMSFVPFAPIVQQAKYIIHDILDLKFNTDRLTKNNYQ